MHLLWYRLSQCQKTHYSHTRTEEVKRLNSVDYIINSTFREFLKLARCAWRMTTDRPAAATQMRTRVSPAMHPKIVFMPDALIAANLPISGLWDQL